MIVGTVLLKRLCWRRAPPFSMEELEAAFGATVTGTWTTDTKACPGASGNSDDLLVEINSKGARNTAGRCDFLSLKGSGNSWKVVASCDINGSIYKTSVTLDRSEKSLKWSSAKGVAVYYRCSE